MLDSADYINVDSKLLPPFETFIPPLRTSGAGDVPTGSAGAAPMQFCYHGYTDWSTAALPHDVIWWPSGDVTADEALRVAADWSSGNDWQPLSRKLSM